MASSLLPFIVYFKTGVRGILFWKDGLCHSAARDSSDIISVQTISQGHPGSSSGSLSPHCCPCSSLSSHSSPLLSLKKPAASLTSGASHWASPLLHVLFPQKHKPHSLSSFTSNVTFIAGQTLTTLSKTVLPTCFLSPPCSVLFFSLTNCKLYVCLFPLRCEFHRAGILFTYTFCFQHIEDCGTQQCSLRSFVK